LSLITVFDSFFGARLWKTQGYVLTDNGSQVRDVDKPFNVDDDRRKVRAQQQSVAAQKAIDKSFELASKKDRDRARRNQIVMEHIERKFGGPGDKLDDNADRRV
jgi:hypothetical protein